jgi:DNA modification methylase
MNTAYQDPAARLIQGDALDVLAEMPERSVDVICTSPPYFGLRVYDSASPDNPLGAEPSVALYIAHLMEFMAAMKRVLKDTGVVWINLGDSYSGGNYRGGGIETASEKQRSNAGTTPFMATKPNLSSDIPALNLAGVPQRFFIACQEQGWIVRSEIILAKDSPMPESLAGWRWTKCRVKVGGNRQASQSYAIETGQRNSTGGMPPSDTQWADCPGCEKCLPNGGLVLRKGSWRPTTASEKLFMLTKGDGYFSDGEDVKQRSITNDPRRPYTSKGAWELDGRSEEKRHGGEKRDGDDFSGANLRSVWPMKSSNFTMQLCKSCKRVYTGAQFGRLNGGPCSCGALDWLSHFAAYHPSLPTTCILASTSARGNCSNCGMPFVRVMESTQHEPEEDYTGQAQKDYGEALAQNPSDTKRRILLAQARESKTLDWRPSCSCGAEPTPAVVLDPFNGTASTGVAARRLGRRYIGIDTSSDYLLLSKARLEAETVGML